MAKKPDRRPEPPKSDLATGTGIVLKNAIEALAGGSALTDLWQAREQRLKEAAAKENEKRLADFYRNLLQADEGMDQAQADALLDDGDFHALLRACVADIESEKTAAYAALARAIATGRVQKTWRRHYILSLRDMSSQELACMQKAFVARNHKLMPPVGSSVDERHFLKSPPAGTLEAIIIASLTARGFVNGDQLTPAGASFIQTCMRASHLTPAAIGYREWTDWNVAVINYQIGDGTQDKLADAICHELRQHCVKSAILAVTRDVGRQHMMFSHAVLLIGSRSGPIAEHMEYLKQFIRSKPLLALCATSSSKTVLPDDLRPQETIDVAKQDLAIIAQSVRQFVLKAG